MIEGFGNLVTVRLSQSVIIYIGKTNLGCADTVDGLCMWTYLIVLYVAVHIAFLLFCRDGIEVAVVYFRCGYVPTDFPSNKVSICYKLRPLCVCLNL